MEIAKNTHFQKKSLVFPGEILYNVKGQKRRKADRRRLSAF